MPAPHPPLISKFQIYTDPVEFTEVDKIAISVAQEDQKTFTDLVRQLVGRCATDVEKARTIFRWITVKNLNNIQFDDNLRGDSPLGLLRGIKHGTESYHVLFKRLCSYAGLHCVVIKGYSKSAGYQPGVRFEDNRFRIFNIAVIIFTHKELLECCIRGGCVALRAVQLGRAPPRQRERRAQTREQREERQPKVLNGFYLCKPGSDIASVLRLTR
ncbi:Hillarin [Eumeta japonica]|uniref:Hillarin n=1 Tax=Eumeta variegata TaxID=151549 RepID=A0A4C1ULF2_EUMVA|nr:Hillarin [Eumeta japonica]